MSETAFSEEVHFELADARRARMRVGRSPGENGVAVVRARLDAGFYMRVKSPDNWIMFSLGDPARIDCRIADRRHVHTLQIGKMGLLPADSDASAYAEGPVDALLLRIATPRVAVGAAERDGAAAGLVEQLAGRDDALMRLAASLFAEMRDGYVNGPLFWNEVADRAVDHLIDHHLSRAHVAVGGTLAPATVARLVEFVRTHIADPLDVGCLAAVAGVSRFHFTRLFARSVGMTPHRYVMKLRVDEAVSLARESRLPLAEVALAAGFADQSHLSRWVRRVHGITPAQLVA